MIAIGYIGSLSFHLLVLYSYNPFFLMTQRWQKAGINEINFFISPADEARAIARDYFVDILDIFNIYKLVTSIWLET